MLYNKTIRSIFVLSNHSKVNENTKHCEVMKLADMPSCLGGEDHAINAR